MSEPLEMQFESLTNEQLIDLALESVGDDREAIRHAALVEHYHRTKNSPQAIHAPAGDLEALQRKFQKIIDDERGKNSSNP